MSKIVHNLLEQYFDTIVVSPDGISKLRKLILTLAMQGKLVEQDPNDPPASELLKEIETEKQRLVKEKKIKQSKPLTPINPKEVPYELPQGWEWVRFFTPNTVKSELIPVKNFPNENQIGPDSIEKNLGRLLFHRTVVESGITGLNNRFYEGQILYSKINPSLNKVVVAPYNGLCSTDIYPIVCHVNTLFMLNVILSEPFLAQVRLAENGVKMPRLNLKSLGQLVVPIPPLPEQHRIVTRIDQLIARCNELEKLRKQRKDKRLTIHTAAIKQLLDALDGAGWGFIQQHFDELYSVRRNVAELRKAILQLAVMGRLVPQEPNDLPASELLKEIKVEKQRLVEEGKIKKPRKFPLFNPSNIPYKLPKGWTWTHLGTVGNIFNGNSINAREKQTKYFGVNGLPYISTKDVGYGFDALDYKNGIYIPESEEKFKIAHQGAVLICSEGGSAGKKCGITEHDICFGNKLFANELFCGTPSKFILYLYLSPSFKKSFNTFMTGIIGGVSIAKFLELPIPLPPLSEQHRIVARIDQLMDLCNRLEQQIEFATEKQSELLDVVMAQA